jgi:beta-glucanase (GH16 family)
MKTLPLILFGASSLTLSDGEPAIGRHYDDPSKPMVWNRHAVPAPPDPVPAAPPLPPAPEGSEWRLTFEDDFDGKSIDGGKWRVFDKYPRKGGFWMKDCVELDGNGKLVISVDRDNDPVTSEPRKVGGSLESRGRFEQRYGYFVCRYRMLRQNGRGYHCAFWLQSETTGSEENGGRDGTEVDIIEKFKTDDHVQHALHWDGYGDAHKCSKLIFPWPGIKKGFHTYGVVWSPEEYVFYIDGVETWRTSAGGVSQVPAYLKLSLEFSEGWNGRINDARLPDEFVVDWVKCYKPIPSKTGKQG